MRRKLGIMTLARLANSMQSGDNDRHVHVYSAELYIIFLGPFPYLFGASNA